MQTTDPAIRIRHVLEPGDLGMIVHLHGVLYAREYGLNTDFEPYVAKPLAEFASCGRGRMWIAARGAQVVGSIAIVDAEPGIGQLRWFLLRPEVRGRGLGRRLLDEAIAYGRERGFSGLFLWSFSDLAAALRLYRRAGFTTTLTKRSTLWGGERTEVRMDLALGAAAKQFAAHGPS
jgi:ribosomal protein S18 acetylase RimI-like enzyme